MTTRGFRAAEMPEVGKIIVEALTTEPDGVALDRLLQRSLALTKPSLYPTLGVMAGQETSGPGSGRRNSGERSKGGVSPSWRSTSGDSGVVATGPAVYAGKCALYS